MYNSNTSINNGNVMNFTQNSSTNQQFSQQSSSYQHHQQQVGSIPPQNNYHQSQQHNPQLWTTESQQTNNYHPQQASNNSNGFTTNNIAKGGADISNSNSFRGQTSNPAATNMPPSNASHQEVAGFSNQTTPATSNQVGQQQNITPAINPSWNDGNASQQNIDPSWSQQMGPNWSQQAQSQLQTQVQPQQSSLQRTFDYVQQCQNWNT